jgi:hypothetical protein
VTSVAGAWNGGHLTFRSCAGTQYESWHYHRGGGGSPRKSVWVVSRQDEADLFCDSESGNWLDLDGNLWGIASNGAVTLGTRGERFAHFTPPSGAAAAWHGYPVTNNPKVVTSKFRRDIPDEVVRKWHDSERIDYVTFVRIARRAL